MADVFTQINSQVVLATEHVLGRALNSDDQDRLVNQALAEISRECSPGFEVADLIRRSTCGRFEGCHV